MCDLLDQGVPPQRIFYVTGELVDDHHALVALLTRAAPDRSPAQPAYLLVDEVTYIRGWDRGVKFLADAGLLEDVILVLTGSDSVIIHEARTFLPGRRGRAPRVDFHLYPLSFSQYLEVSGIADDSLEPYSLEAAAALTDAFQRYLMHGGYLTAINDMAAYGRIEPATFAVYCDCIRGDMAKRGKQEHFLNEILGSVVRRYGSQVTWNNLARDLSIDHPATVADYIALLSRMNVLIVQYALREDRLAPAPKKARKVAFADPFIFHAVRSWLDPVEDPFANQVEPALADPERTGKLAEACTVAHHHRLHPTFTSKAMAKWTSRTSPTAGFSPLKSSGPGRFAPRT